jgi:hypothetical protein
VVILDGWLPVDKGLAAEYHVEELGRVLCKTLIDIRRARSNQPKPLLGMAFSLPYLSY